MIRDLLVLTKNDRLLVATRAIMDPLIQMIDGLTIVCFPNETENYLYLEDAIQWVIKECDLNPSYAKKRGVKTLEALQRIERQFSMGELEIVEV